MHIMSICPSDLRCTIFTPKVGISWDFCEWSNGGESFDYVDQVQTILRKFGVVPVCRDYPDELKKFMGRNIWKDTIDSINTNPNKWGIFVKPVRDKAFTGRVIHSPKDLVGCGNCHENYEVLCCDVIEIKREWRGFITYDELVDIRPYN